MKYQSADKPELWQSAITLYRKLIDVHGWKQEPMLELVRWLSASEYANWFYPDISHQYLCLSFRSYSERYEVPKISVVYDGHHKHFAIDYQSQYGQSLLKIQRSSEQVKADLSTLMVRFKMENAA